MTMTVKNVSIGLSIAVVTVLVLYGAFMVIATVEGLNRIAVNNKQSYLYRMKE